MIIDLKKLLILFIIITIPLLIILSSENAEAQIKENNIESFSDYDKELLQINPDGSKTYRGSFYTYERIFDGNSWVRSSFNETETDLFYKSAYMDFKLDKTDCSFSLLNVTSNEYDVEKFFTEISIDTIRKLNVCQIENISINDYSLNFTTNNGEFKTDYNLKFRKGIELTYDFSNSKGKTTTYEFIETCKNCNPEYLDNNLIRFGSYIYDTKNEQHETFKSYTESRDDFKITFEKTLADKESFRLDPTITPTSSDLNYMREINNNDVCDDTGGTYETLNDGSSYSLTPTLATVNIDCYRIDTEFNISGISVNAIISDSDIDINVNSIVTTENHDFYLITTSRPTTGTVAQRFDAVNNGQLCINNQSISSTGVQSFDLSATCDTAIETHRDSFTWIGVGIKLDSETLGAGARGLGIQDGGNTVPPKLTITYTEPTPPNEPTNLKTTTTSNSNINLSWTTPSSDGGSPITGYRIFYESPSGNGFTILSSNTGNTSVTYSSAGLSSGTQYNYKVAGINVIGVGNNSTAKANYTRTDAPTSLQAVTISASRIDLSWVAPSGFVNGYKIERESPIGGGFSTLVSNTTTTDITYSNTGLSSGTEYNYRVSAHNTGGTSTTSSTASNSTFQNIGGNFYINFTQVGDAIGVTPFFSLTQGAPNPTLTSLDFKNGSTILESKSLGYELQPNGTIIRLTNSNFYKGSLGQTPSTYKVTFNIQNSSGVFGFDSNNTGSIIQLFEPNYITNINGHIYNYTHSRLDQYDYLNVTRNSDSQILNCNYASSTNPDGTWINITGLPYYYKTFTAPSGSGNLYIRCYNPSNLVFSITSFGNATGSLASFAGLDNILGNWLGVPLASLWILLLASISTKSNSHIFTFFILAGIGIMGAIGFVTMDTGLWALIMIVGLLAIVGKSLGVG